MADQDLIFTCSGCGASRPRSDMFGVEPDLLCEDCAEGVRKRMHVRFRPLSKEHTPHVTAAALAIAGALAVCTMLIWRGGADTQMPGWLLGLYQDEWPAHPIWEGEIWRNWTCIFLHGGLLHIAMNGFALWYLGRALETAYGSWTMAGVLLLTGGAASSVEYIFSGGGVGLSGAVYGVAGFLWAQRKVNPAAAAVMTESLRRLLLMWLLIGIVLTVTNVFPIGNWAHGGGLVGGLLLGFVASHEKRRALVPATAVLLLAVTFASMYVAIGTVTLEGGREISRGEWRSIYLEQRARRP